MDLPLDARLDAPASSGPMVGPLSLRGWRIFAALVFPLYVLLTWKLIGLRGEHVLISALFMALFMINAKTARFAMLALPFLCVGILYENLRFVLHLRGEIHVGDLYAAEKALFSVGGLTYNEYFLAHPLVFFDLICGFAYLAYLGESFLFAGYLFFRDQDLLQRFAYAFLFVNLLGMITYLVYPAAPPWYVELHGTGVADLAALPSAAGAARFDELTGLNVFKSFYSRNANVFGAMPSLHCAYPTLVWLTTLRMGPRWYVPAAAFALLIMFSAVYLRHHYVLDVIAGVVFAVVAYGSVVFVQRRWRLKHA